MHTKIFCLGALACVCYAKNDAQLSGEQEALNVQSAADNLTKLLRDASTANAFWPEESKTIGRGEHQTRETVFKMPLSIRKDRDVLFENYAFQGDRSKLDHVLCKRQCKSGSGRGYVSEDDNTSPNEGKFQAGKQAGIDVLEKLSKSITDQIELRTNDPSLATYCDQNYGDYMLTDKTKIKANEDMVLENLQVLQTQLQNAVTGTDVDDGKFNEAVEKVKDHIDLPWKAFRIPFKGGPKWAAQTPPEAKNMQENLTKLVECYQQARALPQAKDATAKRALCYADRLTYAPVYMTFLEQAQSFIVRNTALFGSFCVVVILVVGCCIKKCCSENKDN